jgi:copper(I)-binding protein
MRKLDQVSIGAGERVAFAPGGRHLMIYDLDPSARSPVVIRFTFADHAPVAVEFAIRDRAGAGG